ncbi:putative mRNA capping enzyme alpha subunit [Phlyctochytrium arcticum]|nr:putative mRNA capping enzyme alpha subunit [Phlyctochytrium arcticum]
MLPTIPGVLVKEPKLYDLQQLVNKLMGARQGFPGAQPISFAGSHLKELERENYFVSEKADGIRCLMFTTTNFDGRGSTYLIDRKNHYYFLDYGLPIPQRLDKLHMDTVLDGELVLDTYPDGREILWFLLFDCVVIDGKSLVDRPYTKRLGYLKSNILEPYKQLMQRDAEYARYQPFRMDLKPLQLSYHLRKVFEDIPQLKHKSDGIIFTSSVAPYTIGTCDKMLKWKPAEENTVDFKVKIENGYSSQPRYFLMLWEGGNQYSDFGELTLENELRERWLRSPPDGAIIECRYDPKWSGTWRFARFRDDKQHANHRNTYRKIMDSIRDGISQQQLMEHASIIRDRWKEREAAERR